jgi:NAD(P)H-quinone oxidoreductase subunit 2
MMVVKEPQEMSDAVKNYPVINWTLTGMRPLQVGIVLSLVATSLAGILSNPLFTLATDSVTTTPILQSAALATRIPGELRISVVRRRNNNADCRLISGLALHPF